ncbi:helix-turn-helix domain containing protein [Nocardiopsis sp. RSe5-2]|uniref:Helix-turn-helix domain containing protein n=1 Tax=Nocardiopsis endophytica TaxID=3018445 RepID=A0ABT4U395_9ACTN|nr:TetR/AcrR family transcriptional regulator [Nocardiopsis endophytica]MDA2811428.1 helix-turn-helix domain containing protein [Nocardiopsis endophytica]
MTDGGEDASGLRADARRNRRMVIDAARETIAERGADAPLEEIARRAGVGIATLYRRFPDRLSLVRAVAEDNMRVFGEEAERAQAEEPDPWRALTRVCHAAVERRVGMLLPSMLPHLREALSEHGTLWKRRAEVVGRLEGLLAEAQREGLVRGDIGLGDLLLGIVKLARPLPGMDAELDGEAAHRQLALYLEGLQAARPGPGAHRPRTIADVDRELGI